MAEPERSSTRRLTIAEARQLFREADRDALASRLDDFIAQYESLKSTVAWFVGTFGIVAVGAFAWLGTQIYEHKGALDAAASNREIAEQVRKDYREEFMQRMASQTASEVQRDAAMNDRVNEIAKEMWEIKAQIREISNRIGRKNEFN